MKKIARSFFSGLTLIVVALFVFTAETIADEAGWTDTVRAFVKGGWSAVVDAGYSDWLMAGTLFFGGITAALWGDHFFREWFPVTFSKKKKRVEGQTFRHTKLVIDGKSFHNCTFDGVRLVYNGTGFYDFVGCRFLDFSISVETDSAKGAVALIKLLQASKRPVIFEGSQPQLPPETES